MKNIMKLNGMKNQHLIYRKKKEEEQHEITPITPSSGLNPEATPFLALSTAKIESTQSISTGDESDDENDSNETPITSGK